MLAFLFSLMTMFSWQATPVDIAVAADSLPATTRASTQHDRTDSVFHVSQIVLVGNRITRDRIILRELTLKPGDTVSTKRLARILDLDKKKLINTRLFNTVDLKIINTDPGFITLAVDVTERWYTFPSPIFELSDRNFNEWWQNYNHDFRRVNYGLKLYQFNMRGRNETVRLVAQLGFVRKLELTYRIPYIDRKQKQGLIFDFDFSETKNLAIRTVDHKLVYLHGQHVLRYTRGGSIAYTFRNSFYRFHMLKAEYRSNSVTDSVVYHNPEYFKTGQQIQRYGVLMYQFTSDRRDYFGYPLKGHYLLANAIQYGVLAKDDVNKFETTVSYARFLDLKKGWYFATNVVGYWSTPKQLPYDIYGALGYRKQFIRGYEIYVIEGPWYAINKATLKKRIISRTYRWERFPIPQFRHIPINIFLKTYADLGYVSNYPVYESTGRNTLLSNKLLSGTGIGLDIVGAYDAVFRFEYSFNAIGGKGLFIHIKREF